MALVLGEDSESDEEINTEELAGLVLTPDGSITGYQGLMKNTQPQKTAGIVMGEESETDDEEEDGNKEGSEDQSDSSSLQGRPQCTSSQNGSNGTQQSQKSESLEPASAPPS